MFLTFEQVSQFHKDGYLLVENLFSSAEVNKMIESIEIGERIVAATREKKDSEGRVAKLSIWHELGNDLWSSVSTCPRMVNNVRILMGEEISFFHGKVMLKEAHSGGSWEWHQDYGYWYNQGFLYPHLMSAFTALDPATRENGCLRVLKGSHRLGRLDHTKSGDQTGADPSKISQIENMFELVEVEMNPGSVLYFHCNLLHSSAANLSDHHRRAFIICYSAWGNPQLQNGRIIERDVCPVGTDDEILHRKESFI